MRAGEVLKEMIDSLRVRGYLALANLLEILRREAGEKLTRGLDKTSNLLEVIDWDNTVRILSKRLSVKTPTSCDVVTIVGDEVLFLEIKRYKKFLKDLKDIVKSTSIKNLDTLSKALIDGIVKSLLLKYFDTISVFLFLFPLLTDITSESRLTLLRELNLTIALLPVKEEMERSDEEDLALSMAVISALPCIDISSIIENALNNSLTEMKSLALPSELSHKARYKLFRNVFELVGYLTRLEQGVDNN